MKIKIYTAQCGDYEIKRNDNVEINKNYNQFVNPVLNAKIFKILGHLFYPDYDILIWIDGNIESKLSPEQLVEKYLQNNDFVISKHPFRDNIWDEFEELINTKRLELIRTNIVEQKEFYQKYKNLKHELYECNFFIRRNIPAVNTMMQAWWSEITRFSYRDQVSFPIVLEKYRKFFKFNAIDLYNIRNHADFIYTNHYNLTKKNSIIHEINC